MTVPWSTGVGVGGRTETITQDDVVRFAWSPPISLSLTQVTKAGFEACDANNDNLIRTWSVRTTEAEVDIESLPVSAFCDFRRPNVLQPF